MAVPKDSYNIVYILFYLMSIGILLPWNFLINVNGYWMYKFRTVHNATIQSNATVQTNTDSNQDKGGRNRMQLEFTADLAIAAEIPVVLVFILNGIFGHRLKTTPRLLVSLLIVVITFIVILIFTDTNTDGWQGEFLTITLLTTVVINAAAAVFQGGFRGVVGIFPPAYMSAVLSGTAVGGVFTAAINILLLAVGGDHVSAAFYCFAVAIAILILCFISFLFVIHTAFYLHYIKGSENSDLDETSPLIASKTDNSSEISVIGVLCELWQTSLSMLLIFIATLSCFPALTVLIESTGKNSSDSTSWHHTYFVPVACFLFYNIGDYLGRLASSFQFPHPGPSLTLVLSLARFAFLPLFLLCNASPANRYFTPVIFHSDAIYIVLMLVFSISNGYLVSVCFLAAQQGVKPHLQMTAANLMISILGVGLIIGGACSAALVQLL